MDVKDLQPIDRPADYSGRRPLFYLVVLLPTLLGLAHHIDHIIRGNHVGWPITPHVNPFTYSLVIYPLIVIGVYLTVTDRVGVRYWTGVFGFSAVLLAYVHISPWAIEPPADVIGPYANPLVGYAAFVILLALIASVGVGTLYVAVLWYRQRGQGGGSLDRTGNR
ncbi:MAG: hypothetical protein SVG88_10495 [Halobacteriales archaeon]|nr:hypothetical protein [Halobacteriales archaeon]